MSIISNSMFPFRSSFQHISNMKDRFDKLQGQLATGQKAATLAEMGTDRFFDLTMRARLSKIAGYQDTIKWVSLRLDVMDTTMTRLDKLEADQRTLATPGGYGSGNINLATTPELSLARLDEVLDLLNASVDGRYLFGGSTTDKKPMMDVQSVLDGALGRDGFRTVVGERKLADAGPDGLGRLTIATAADTVSLAEDGIHPFGFKLSTLSTSSSSVALTQPAGSPPSLSVQFAALPVAGEQVTIGLTLPDGTEEVIRLTASSGATEAGSYQIGADEAATAANFATALEASLEQFGKTTLAAASTFAAADNFFNGTGETVMRVDGPPFETATALVAATPADTVLWYQGEDGADPRGTVTAKIEDNTSVKYGVQANENGIVTLVRTLAAMAVETYPSADATSSGRFDGMAERQQERLSEAHNNEAGSVEVIAVELSLAKTRTGNISERLIAGDAQLNTMLEELEGISKEAVAMEMLALQTRLEASYQATSLVAQLSLVNYM